MTNNLGPIDITCDSPGYAVVRGCLQIGMRRPEDVRWWRMSHFFAAVNGTQGLFQFLPWKSFLGVRTLDAKHCSCGQELPELEKYTFTFMTGREESYYLGQCGKCDSIFWEES